MIRTTDNLENVEYRTCAFQEQKPFRRLSDYYVIKIAKEHPELDIFHTEIQDDYNIPLRVSSCQLTLERKLLGELLSDEYIEQVAREYHQQYNKTHTGKFDKSITMLEARMNAIHSVLYTVLDQVMVGEAPHLFDVEVGEYPYNFAFMELDQKEEDTILTLHTSKPHIKKNYRFKLEKAETVPSERIGYHYVDVLTLTYLGE